MSSRRFATLATGLTFTLGMGFTASGTAQADLLLQEGFNYDLGEGLGGQTFTGTGSVDGAWSAGTGGEMVAGLNFSNLAVSGNAFQTWSPDENSYAGERSLKSGDAFTYTNSDTLWTSYLFQQKGDYTDGSFAFDTGRSYMHMAFAQGGTYDGVGVGTTPSISGSAETKDPVFSGNDNIYDGEVYMILARFVNPRSDVTATVWALSENDFNQLVADSWNEATLDTHHQQTATLTTTGSLYDNRDTAAYLYNRGYHANKLIVDELRVGTSLADVTPVTAVVPEPASLTLLTLGAGLVILRRRDSTAA